MMSIAFHWSTMMSSLRHRFLALPFHMKILYLRYQAVRTRAAPVLAELYNMSLLEGYLPPLLKSAVVRPLPKTSPPECVEDDIRPISLTSQLAKMMEGFDVLPHLDTKQVAVAGKSTTHAIIYLLHLALEALDRGNCWINLFFADFRKGFDLIDHNILLYRLKSFNIHPALLR